MIGRYGSPPVKGRKYTQRTGAYAILPFRGAVGGSLLLTVQSDPKPDLQLPGGGIDPGESPIVALHREVMEETGWRIANPRRIGAFRRFVYMPEYDLWAEKLCLIYTARPTLQISEPTEAGHTAVWMEPSDALGLLQNPGDRNLLSIWLSKSG